ncbi:LOW QUALITY PROTEIN: cilia- and flagella-associated protein 206-like [Vespula pensylvanica]|uniref:LOW QUALITY PROTEIN: cilia- and flagella-associated protein 206-like n=1 Tax=Vespula pensylvanica TaxID=30213 RepID=UPI001CBA1EEF|nr:LOW QUALITY PROTEIN: cilia- and flagella-associated protein 206-like [Vespula pensylvanica]
MNNMRKILIKKILHECNSNKIHVTHDIVSFLLSLTQLNPAYQLIDDDEISHKKLIEVIKEKLQDQSRPSLTTLKNQLYYAKHYRERGHYVYPIIFSYIHQVYITILTILIEEFYVDEIIKKHRISLHRKTTPLVTEICETDKIENDQEVEKLYQKIIIVITLLSGLGNPAVTNTLREVTATLQSVFQPSELLNYVKLPMREKEEQLMELMCIVAGIRLFNRDCERGGKEIDDLPSILQDAVKKTYDDILELLERLMTKVYEFTATVENIISFVLVDEDYSDDICYSTINKIILPENIKEDNYERVIEILTASRQQEIYIRKLLSDVEHSGNIIKSLIERLRQRLIRLHETMRYRTAIPTTQVYPQFIDLADIWMGLQDEVIILSNINNFLWEIHNLNIKVTQKVHFISRQNRFTKDSRALQYKIHHIRYVVISLTYLTDHFIVEFLGFCAWMFVTGKGALIPANPNNGVAKWRGRYYAFSSAAAAHHFGKEPDKYVSFTNERSLLTRLTEDELELKTCQDQTVQTDTHILPPSIENTNYIWNVWELRRRALSLANIAKCATKSTQTHMSHFRSGACVQAAPPKDKEVQTKRDNYMNTKKLLTYIFGLRGRRDNNQHVLSFLEEEFEHL